MNKSFNENSRVKIPAIVHLTRLKYKYVSLQQVEQLIDSEINIYKKSECKHYRQAFDNGR